MPGAPVQPEAFDPPTAGYGPHVTGTLPRASILDTLRVGVGVLAPTVAKGTILRRRPVVALAAGLDQDRRALGVLQRMRARYGPGPLRLRVPGRSVAVVLSPDHVHRVLAESPEPFALATREKRAALSHFQPDGVLVSRGAVREQRRHLNERVLDADQPLHHLAPDITSKVRDEMAYLMASATGTGALTWDSYSEALQRMVRRVVLGDAARDDERLTHLLNTLRADANWAYLRPKRTAVREQFTGALQSYLWMAEPGSLAAALAATPATEQTEPEGQVPQWLFAFDAAGIAAFRTLALLATHPAQAARVHNELAARDLSRPQHLPYLRSCVLEVLRLWPTTPAVLRESTTETTWDGAPLPANSTLLILTQFFGRDGQTVAHPDRFTPERWLEPPETSHAALVPFSAGPGICPGRNLVLLVTSTLLATLFHEYDLRLVKPRQLDPRRPLPGTLNHTAIRFATARK